MHFQYDITLLTLSLLACTIAALIIFDFVERLYIAPNSSRNKLLPIFALVIGSSIWANHILLSFAFKLDLGEARNAFPSMTIIAWGFACITAFLNLNAASKRQLAPLTIVVSATLAGLSTLGLYYFDSASIHGFATMPSPDSFSTLVSLAFTIMIITGLIFTLNRIKDYSGVNPIPVKLLTALIVSLGVVAVHVAFDQAFAHGEAVTEATIYTQFMGIIVALVLLSIILIAFIFVLFFEKYGKQLFKFSFFNHPDESINAQGTVDSLTKLANRNGFQQQLETARKRSERGGTTFALAYIDLDHFKPINDQYGHQVGDVVLTAVAQRLNAAVRGCDFVARIGGDEFVAIIEEIKSNEDINPIADRIVQSIKEPFSINNLTVEISCSVGIALYPQDGDLAKLMVCADAAMYKAKESGKNQFKFYDADIESASDQMLELQRDLCIAIEKSEFSLSYQPKMDCKTLAPLGAEALIRWNHPTKGEVLPKTFIAAAERFGLINEISDWVIDETCRMIASAKQGGLDLNISINLSSHQFRNPNLVKDVLKTLKYYDLDTHNLTFEIKETIAIRNQEQFKLLLEKFNEAGIKVVLDDFGLHPISLAYLQDLNVTEIKLDKSFVADADQGKNAKSLIDAVVKLAHALNLRVVAEGVETQAQHDALVELNCDYMQGYLFSMPVKEVELIALYKQMQANQYLPKAKVSNKFSPADHGTIAA